MKKQKNAVVFGATSGIGKALAGLLVDDGYTVVITGRRKQKLDEIRQGNPERFKAVQHDVTDLESTDQLFKDLKEELGTIDLVVYSSGVATPNYGLDWEKQLPTLQTNVLGAVKVFDLSYRLFHEQGYGHLVGISSVAGIRGNRHVPAYFASKAFQNNYLESLWMKAKRSKADIYVTDIAPGFVDTKMALGNTFGVAPLDKAVRQIFKAIKRKKKKAYITRRWFCIAQLMRILPAGLIMKTA